MVALLALYSFGGLFVAGLAIPLVLRKIPPNGLYGFRTRSTQDNPQLWYKINVYAGWRLLVLGLGTSLSAIILYYPSGQNLEQYALSCLGLFLALFLWAMISTFLYLKSVQ